SADWCDRREMMNTLIVGLCSREGRVARLATASHDPMAYLAECLLSWMREQWGSRSTPLAPAHEWLIERDEAQPGEQRYTEIREVISLTHNWLAPHTPARLRPVLSALLKWLAHNPPQRRSYEAVEREAAR